MTGVQTHRLARLVVNYSAGDAMATLLNLAGVVVVVRAISVEQFGLADVLRTAQWFLASLLGLNVFESASRFYFDSPDREEQRRILGGGLAVQLLSGFVATGVLLLLSNLGQGFLGLRLEGRTVWLAALGIPANNLVMVLVQTTVIRGRVGLYGILVVLQAALSLTGIALFVVWLRLGLDGYLLALLLGATLTGLMGYLLQSEQYRWNWPVGPLRAYLRFGGPSMISELIQYGFGLYIRVLLLRLASPVAVGWYGFAERMQVPVNLVVAAAGRVWLPWLLSERPALHERVSAQVRQLNGFVLLALGVFVIFLRELIVLVGGERYHGAFEAALLLLIARWIFFIGDWIVSASLNVAKQTHYRLWVFAGSYVVAAAVSIWTVSLWSSAGAAAGAVVSSALILLGMIGASRAVYPLRLGLRRLLPASGLAVGLALFGSLLTSVWLKPIFLAGYVVSLGLLGLSPLSRAERASRTRLT